MNNLIWIIYEIRRKYEGIRKSTVFKQSNKNKLIKIKKYDKKKDWYSERKDELFKLMKYYNHSDNAKFDWRAWDIDIDGITKLEENSKMDVLWW